MGEMKSIEDRLNLLRMRTSILMINFEADRFGNYPRGGWEISLFTNDWIRRQSDSLEEVISKAEEAMGSRMIIPDSQLAEIQAIHDKVKKLKNTEYYIMPIGGGWKAGLSRWTYRAVLGGGLAKEPFSNRKMVGNTLGEVIGMLQTGLEQFNEQ